MKIAQPALMFDTSTIAEITNSASLSRFVAEHGVALSGPAPIPTRDDPAPMMTRTAPGLTRRLAARSL